MEHLEFRDCLVKSIYLIEVECKFAMDSTYRVGADVFI